MDEPLARCPETGKACRSHHDNDAWLADYRKRKSARMPRLRGYECEACGWWHVTSMTRKGRDKQQKRQRRGVW